MSEYDQVLHEDETTVGITPLAFSFQLIQRSYRTYRNFNLSVMLVIYYMRKSGVRFINHSIIVSPCFCYNVPLNDLSQKYIFNRLNEKKIAHILNSRKKDYN